MRFLNIFGKGKAVYGKHSSKLNVTSDRIDRRLKENAAYRSSKPRKGQLVKEDGETYIVFSDGEKVETEIKL